MRKSHINYCGWVEMIRRSRMGCFEVDYRWLNFDRFNKDMGPKPAKGWCLTRKDLDSGYYKENCYWAKMYERSGRTKIGKYYAEYRKKRKALDLRKRLDGDQGLRGNCI